MKKIEDIEKMSLEELEAVSADASVKVPESLAGKLEALVGAAELSKAGEKPRFAWGRWAAGLAVAAALSVGVFFAFQKGPKDSFDDPYLAYAEVQQVFERISREGDKAAQIAGKAVPVMEKTEKIINGITK